MFSSQKIWPKGGDALDFFRDQSYLIHRISDIDARTCRPGHPLDDHKNQSTTCSSRNVDSFDLSLTHGLLGNILIHELDFGCRIVSFAGVTSKLSQIDIVFWKASIKPTLRARDTEP